MPLRFPPKQLSQQAAEIFAAAGAPPSSARLVADSLVEANLAGHDSHGVIRVKEYLDAILQGRIQPRAQPHIYAETPTTLQVDGGFAFGQVVATWTMDRLLQKAATSYLAAGGIRHCGHVGRLGAYVQQAAEQGFIAFAFVNGGAREPRLAPHGGARPVFGTNPLAVGLPVKGRPPVVIDFSTAAIAAGKIRVARDKGESLPEGCIVDREGRPSCNPADYYNGGMLLPAAGHKGYALALLVEILAGVLSGAGSPVLEGWGTATTNGAFFIVLSPRGFTLAEEFASSVARLSETVKAVPAVAPQTEVLLPGEPETRTAAARLPHGIELPETTWLAIQAAAARVGVPVTVTALA